MADKKYKLKFGMSDGTEKSVEFTAPQGEPGITPVVAVSDIAGGHRVTITTGNNVQTIDVMDGKNGDPGKNGITPTVSVTEIEGGHRVTITTGSNVQSFDVLDGEGGGTAGAVTWENVTGKPFNESLTGTAVVNGDTLSWDGNLDAMPIVVTPNNYNKWIYVSDNVPTMEQISTGHTLAFKAYNGSEININITPSESENYIYVGDIDGQYLYIIKKPCTVGSMVFERAGIYFYSDSEATTYTCRLTINGYTFTEMDSIKDAYIPQTIARKSDIPQGGGAQVQSDYTQHDATQPDYIRNRPFWPEWSPVLFSERTEFGYLSSHPEYSTDFVNNEDVIGGLTPPDEGKRYTFCIKDKQYIGTAVSGVFSCIVGTLDGIRIDVGQDDIVIAYEDNLFSHRWIFVLPDSIIDAGEEALVTIIEGENEYNKLSAADDAIDIAGIPQGASVVQDITGIVENASIGDAKAVSMYNALKSDVEITVDMGGTEITLAKDAITFVENADMMGVPCDLYMYGQAPLGVIIHNGDMRLLALLDLNALEMGAVTTKSIKVNYPGIFAPTVAVKKMPEECLPGAFIGYTPSVSEGSSSSGICSDPSCEHAWSADSVINAFMRGRPIYICICDGVNDNTYFAVSRIETKVAGNMVKLYYLYSDMSIRWTFVLY